MMMSCAILEKEFRGLDVLRNQEVERKVTEGRFPHGKGAVVQFLGGKPFVAHRRA